MSDPFAGIAPKEAVPYFRSATPLIELGLGPEEGFVLSRIDGTSRLGDLVNLVPFAPERTLEIVKKLWIAGAIEIPGHAPPVVSEKKTIARAPSTPPPLPAAPQNVQVTAAVPAGVDLTLEQVQSIDAFFADLQTKDAFALLGIPRTADKKEIKRAYFRLSKDFHPDRFFAKSLGPYAERLTQIFQALKSSFDLLSDDARRAAYLDSISG